MPLLTTLPSGTMINMAHILIARVDHSVQCTEHPTNRVPTVTSIRIGITFIGGTKESLSGADAEAFLALVAHSAVPTPTHPFSHPHAPFSPIIGSTQEDRA